MQAIEMQQLLHQEIPITEAMGIKIQQLSQHSISILAPFDANKNIHNTAFAGSIYTTATLAGWSLLTHFLALNNLKGSVVMAKGEVKYLQPIHGDIVAECHITDLPKLDTFMTMLKKRNKARLDLEIKVVEDGAVKATLAGNFAVIA